MTELLQFNFKVGADNKSSTRLRDLVKVHDINCLLRQEIDRVESQLSMSACLFDIEKISLIVCGSCIRFRCLVNAYANSIFGILWVCHGDLGSTNHALDLLHRRNEGRAPTAL